MKKFEIGLSKEIIKQAYSRKLQYDSGISNHRYMYITFLIVRLGKCRIKDK